MGGRSRSQQLLFMSPHYGQAGAAHAAREPLRLQAAATLYRSPQVALQTHSAVQSLQKHPTDASPQPYFAYREGPL